MLYEMLQTTLHNKNQAQCFLNSLGLTLNSRIPYAILSARVQKDNIAQVKTLGNVVRDTQDNII